MYRLHCSPNVRFNSLEVKEQTAHTRPRSLRETKKRKSKNKTGLHVFRFSQDRYSSGIFALWATMVRSRFPQIASLHAGSSSTRSGIVTHVRTAACSPGCVVVKHLFLRLSSPSFSPPHQKTRELFTSAPRGCGPSLSIECRAATTIFLLNGKGWPRVTQSSVSAVTIGKHLTGYSHIASSNTAAVYKHPANPWFTTKKRMQLLSLKKNKECG